MTQKDKTRVLGGAAAAALTLGLMAGCTGRYAPPLSEEELLSLDVRAALINCCGEVGAGMSTEFVRVAEAHSFWIAPASRALKLREAWLEDDPEAHAAVIDRARPLDVLLIGNGSRATGAFGEGLMGHVAVYLGSEAELRGLGIWSHPLVVPHQDDIRDGKVAIEALDTDVHLSGRPELFETDHVALYRLRGISPARKGEAMLALFADLGAPFDFHFDNADPTEIYCSELLDRALPELNLPKRIIHGREVILPDDIAARAAIGELSLDLVLYIRGYPVGWRVKDEAALVAELLGEYRK